MMQLSSVKDDVGLASACEMIPCRLVITRDAHSELLLVQDGDDFELPMVEIPKWERTAPHLTTQVFSRWGVKAVVLFNVPLKSVECETTEVRYYVLESTSANLALTNGARWLSEAMLLARQTCAEDATLRYALHQAKTYNRCDSAHTFVRSGWLHELSSWVDAKLSIRGWQLAGEWTQYTIGPSFSLLRCATSGPNVWFKAVGEPNLREYEITRMLARNASAYTPEILATRDDWHGWLAVEAPGHHLDAVWNIELWRSAARSLAKLQLESLGNTKSLLRAGCKDLRLERTSSLICPLFDPIAEVMKQQPVSPPRILTPNDLGMLKNRLQSACVRLQQCEIPAALGHADLNPGNVIVNGERAFFLDWAEATISHPFFTFEYLVALLRRLRPDLECWVDQLREAYCEPWREFYSDEQIMGSLELTPLLAVLAFALGFTDGRSNGEDISPPMAKLMRALARRMHAEALNVDKIDIYGIQNRKGGELSWNIANQSWSGWEMPRR